MEEEACHFYRYDKARRHQSQPQFGIRTVMWSANNTEIKLTPLIKTQNCTQSKIPLSMDLIVIIRYSYRKYSIGMLLNKEYFP